MQSIDSASLKKLYEEQSIIPDAKPVDVKIEEDYKAENVIIGFEGVHLVLTLPQARDFALAIRKAANRIEQHRRERRK